MQAGAELRRSANVVARAAEPLPAFDDPAFGAFDRCARRVVLSGRGEPRHLGVLPGPRRDHPAPDRAPRLHVVAVEADWPDAAVVDAYVRHRPRRDGGRDALPALSDLDVAQHRGGGVPRLDAAPTTPALAERSRRASTGSTSTTWRLDRGGAVLPRRDRPGGGLGGARAIRLPHPWQGEPAEYGRAVLTEGYGGARGRSCSNGGTCWRAAGLCGRGQRGLPRRRAERPPGGVGRALLPDHVLRRRRELEPARQPHVRDARASLERAGPDAKAVVWAHNSHIGDARATDMGIARGELNIGQLCRERLEGEAALIGFGTHAGTVAAATTGTARWRSSRSALPPGELRAAHAMTRRCRASCSTFARRRRASCGGALCRSPGWSGSSA